MEPTTDKPESYYLKRRIDASIDLINDQLYNTIQFCQTLPLGGTELMEQMLRELAITHTKTSVKSNLFNETYTMPPPKMSPRAALEFVYGIHIKERVAKPEWFRIEGDEERFTVSYNMENCAYSAHCKALVCDGLSCICVRRFFYEGIIKLLSKKEYTSTLNTPDLDQEFCSFSFQPRSEARGNLEDIKQRISKTISENVRLRELAQDELRKNKNQIGSILDHSPALIYLKDTNGRYLLVNQRYEELFKVKKTDVVGKTDDELFPGQIAKALSKNDLRVIETQKPIESEEAISDEDGLHTYVSVKFPIFDQAGRLYAVCGISTDTTEYKKLEEREKQQLALMTTGKFAVLGEMAAGIAHEINTPLTSINLAVRQIRRTLTADQQDLDKIEKKLATIEATTDRVVKIIKGLRTFSRDVEQDPFETKSIKEIVAETISLCAEKMKAKNLTIDIDDIDPQLTIESRPVQISQVLMNLLSNSCDAVMMSDKPWIKISCIDLGQEIEISVTDSGLGIESEIQSKMLDPFFTTKVIGEGTGLGLSISKGIIEAHGGKLGFDSHSKNTCFIVKLPKMQGESCA